MIHIHVHGNASQLTTVHTHIHNYGPTVSFERMCTTQLYCAKVELTVYVTGDIVSKSIPQLNNKSVMCCLEVVCPVVTLVVRFYQLFLSYDMYMYGFRTTIFDTTVSLC